MTAIDTAQARLSLVRQFNEEARKVIAHLQAINRACAQAAEEQREVELEAA